MNELDKTLADLVRKGMEVAEQTGNFVIEQAPELLQEFYRWHLTKNIFIATTCILAFIAIVWAFKKMGKDSDRDFTEPCELFGKYYDEFVGLLMLTMGIIIMGGILIAIAFNSLYNVLFLVVAPKLYLIEYFLN